MVYTKIKLPAKHLQQEELPHKQLVNEKPSHSKFQEVLTMF